MTRIIKLAIIAVISAVVILLAMLFVIGSVNIWADDMIAIRFLIMFLFLIIPTWVTCTAAIYIKS